MSECPQQIPFLALYAVVPPRNCSILFGMSTYEARSPAVLRERIQAILSERATNRSDSGLNSIANVLISHPPSPTLLEKMLEGGVAMSCVPLSQIRPLDAGSIELVPLSTPPTPRPESAQSTLRKTSITPDIMLETDYPLILVTGAFPFLNLKNDEGLTSI